MGDSIGIQFVKPGSSAGAPAGANGAKVQVVQVRWSAVPRVGDAVDLVFEDGQLVGRVVKVIWHEDGYCQVILEDA